MERVFAGEMNGLSKSLILAFRVKRDSRESVTGGLAIPCTYLRIKEARKEANISILDTMWKNTCVRCKNIVKSIQIGA